MKKIVMVGPRKSEIVETPIPKIKDNELLVKVTYTGMCHSEWYPWSVAAPGEEFGHESVGIVAECGSKVTDFKVGDRVTGLGGGGYREYIVMEQEKTCHVPDNLKDEDAIVEPLACLLSAALKMKPEMLGDSIAVVGTGYMGLGMISLFKAMGYADIIAVDLRAEARENARKMGATEVYAPEELPSYYRLPSAVPISNATAIKPISSASGSPMSWSSPEPKAGSSLPENSSVHTADWASAAIITILSAPSTTNSGTSRRSPPSTVTNGGSCTKPDFASAVSCSFPAASGSSPA